MMLCSMWGLSSVCVCVVCILEIKCFCCFGSSVYDFFCVWFEWAVVSAPVRESVSFEGGGCCVKCVY